MKSALKKIHHESQATWDEDLPWHSLAFNMAIRDSTKCTPEKAFWGREMKSSLLASWDLTPISKNGTGEDNQSFWTQAYCNLKRPGVRLVKDTMLIVNLMSIRRAIL